MDGLTTAAGLDPAAALAAGIGMVHQHFTLADNLSVLDNVMLGTEPLWQPFSRRAAARARRWSTRRSGSACWSTRTPASPTLSVGERQRVEILKALVPFGRRAGARILILDEPTAVLTPQESESLFATLGQLVAQGLAIIFISHKLDEVLRVSHRIAVLRAGRLVAADAGRRRQQGAAGAGDGRPRRAARHCARHEARAGRRAPVRRCARCSGVTVRRPWRPAVSWTTVDAGAAPRRGGGQSPAWPATASTRWPTCCTA